VDSLNAYASIFFCIPVEALPQLPVEGQRLTTRRVSAWIRAGLKTT